MDHDNHHNYHRSQPRDDSLNPPPDVPGFLREAFSGGPLPELDEDQTSRMMLYLRSYLLYIETLTDPLPYEIEFYREFYKTVL